MQAYEIIDLAGPPLRRAGRALRRLAIVMEVAAGWLTLSAAVVLLGAMGSSILESISMFWGAVTMGLAVLALGFAAGFVRAAGDWLVEAAERPSGVPVHRTAGALPPLKADQSPQRSTFKGLTPRGKKVGKIA